MLDFPLLRNPKFWEMSGCSLFAIHQNDMFSKILLAYIIRIRLPYHMNIYLILRNSLFYEGLLELDSHWHEQWWNKIRIYVIFFVKEHKWVMNIGNWKSRELANPRKNLCTMNLNITSDLLNSLVDKSITFHWHPSSQAEVYHPQNTGHLIQYW